MRTIDATKCSCGQIWVSNINVTRHTAACPAGGHLTRIPIAYALTDAVMTYTEWVSVSLSITTINARRLIERVYVDRGDVFEQIVQGHFIQRLVWFFELFILDVTHCIAEYNGAYVIKTDDGVVKLPKCDATLTWLVRFVVNAYDTVVSDCSLPESRIKTDWSRTTRLPGLREHLTYDDLVDVDVELPKEIRDFGEYIETHTPRLGASDAVDMIKVFVCPGCWWSHPTKSKTMRHIKSCQHIDGSDGPIEPVEPIEPIQRPARIVRVDRPGRKRPRDPTKIPIECIEIETVPHPEMTLDDLANMVRSFTKAIEQDGDTFLLTTRANTPDGVRVERLDRFRITQRVLTELERKLCVNGDDVIESSRVVHDVFSRNWKFSSTFSSTLFEFMIIDDEPPGAAGLIARFCQALADPPDPIRM
jgi:hypothetical protein